MKIVYGLQVVVKVVGLRGFHEFDVNGYPSPPCYFSSVLSVALALRLW